METIYPDNERKGCSRQHTPRPETTKKYREAVELYGSTTLSAREICNRCGVPLAGFQVYIGKYHRHLMLARYGIDRTPEEAADIKMGQRRKQKPATREKYRAAIAACDSMDYIEYNISQIAREFGLEGTNLSRQLRTHYPDVIERREEARRRMGLNDNLPRGTRSYCKEQYAEAVKLLRADRYITVQEVAERCNVSYSGLEQHLIFYHKELVENRIRIRKQAVNQKRKGKITGSGTPHAPKPETVALYAEALQLYRTTPMSVRKIAATANVPLRGLYNYLQEWHQDLICQRKGVDYEEGKPVDWSTVRKYNPATQAKYAEAIRKLKASDGKTTTTAIAAEFGLQPEAFRQYLKEHEPELHAAQGMVRTESGKAMSRRSMEKYAEAVHLYQTTSEPLNAIARRFQMDACAFRDFLKRHYPELVEQRKRKKTTTNTL